MVMEFINGLTEVSLKETGRKTKSQDTEFTTGKMEEYMKDTGNKIICMDKVYISGQMVDNTRANM